MSAPTTAGGELVLAGFGRIEVSSHAVGAELAGYADRSGAARGVHDPLFARALVLDGPSGPAAICTVELCVVGEDVVADARARVARDAGIPADRVLVSATHTHSGPHDVDPACFPDGLGTEIAAAVIQARERARPARVGAGWGMVHGHAMNRRRFEDPVDPAVLVIRVDGAAGEPLGAYCGFGCHPVILGPDNRLVSGDWPGVVSRTVEARLGEDAVVLLGQGSCGDVNPLTPGVAARLRAGGPVAATAAGASYYGPAGGRAPARRIGDRTGGRFAECERLGRAVAAEVLRVRDGIVPRGDGDVRTWQAQVAAGGPPPARASAAASVDHVARGGRLVPRAPRGRALEVMLMAIDGPGVALVGQPGEVFAATGVDLRRSLRAAGVPVPFVIGYANGWRGYLPPAHAFPDGGYEVEWARLMGLPEGLQDDIARAVVATVRG